MYRFKFKVEVCKEKPNLDAIRSILMLYEEIDVNLCDPNGRVVRYIFTFF